MVVPNPLKCEIVQLGKKTVAPVTYGLISRGQRQYVTHAVLFLRGQRPYATMVKWGHGDSRHLNCRKPNESPVFCYYSLLTHSTSQGQPK
jgi:hypothetical protein